MQRRRASSWTLPGFWHEVRGARNLFEDSRDIISLPKSQTFKNAILVIPGFLAPPKPYFSLGAFCNSLGYGVYFPDFHGINSKDRAFSVAAVQTEIHKIKKYFSTFIIVGHSLGGIYGLRHAQDPCVKKVIMIGSPVRYGTPWRLLSKLVLACLTTRGALARARVYFDLEESVQETMLEDIVSAAQPYAKKISTISLTTDFIVPASHAEFPRANNNVIYPDAKMLSHLPARDRGYYSHGGMVNLPEVREILRNILR